MIYTIRMSGNNTIYSLDFSKKSIDECLRNINNLVSSNLVALPGVGVSNFIRHLQSAVAKRGYPVLMINAYEFETTTREELLKHLARAVNKQLKDLPDIQPDLESISSGLLELCETNDRVVLLFNRFDHLQKMYDEQLFYNLRHIREINSTKIVMLFSTSHPLIELRPALVRNNFSLFGNVTFFRPYSARDLSEIAVGEGLAPPSQEMLELSGGHHSLFLVLERCQNLKAPLVDPIVRLLLQDMFNGLHSKRREIVMAIADSRSAQPDPYLEGVGLVNKQPNGSYRLFTILFEKFLAELDSTVLPAKEKKLLALLKRNVGRLVDKQQIIDKVWGDEIVSDWALNSLVYRLRNHAAFDSSRYSIVSRKKQGYVLFDSHTRLK